MKFLKVKSEWYIPLYTRTVLLIVYIKNVVSEPILQIVTNKDMKKYLKNQNSK